MTSKWIVRSAVSENVIIKSLQSANTTLPFSLRQSSSNSSKDPIRQSQEKAAQNLTAEDSSATSSNEDQSEKQPQKAKTIEELDKELLAKMEGLAGDGGEAGRELEDGQPTAMKRSVRNNMFRYI